MARSVEHHFDDAFHVAVRGFQGADIHAQSPSYRGPDLFRVQFLPFDLAALEDIRRECLQDGFPLQVESQSLHMADQAALAMTNRGQRLGKFIHGLPEWPEVRRM